jgi:hypothetical protein
MIANNEDDVFSVYSVSWEVHDGARWKKTSMVATPDKAKAEEAAVRVRTNPRARTRNVAITEKRVREVRTSLLPYWVPAGGAE